MSRRNNEAMNSDSRNKDSTNSSSENMEFEEYTSSYEEVVEEEFEDEEEIDDNQDDVEDCDDSEEDTAFEEEMNISSTTKPANKKGNASDEEEEDWLKALEEGRLHEFDEELKKMKDPKLMTARQRALLISKTEKVNKEDAKAKNSSKAVNEEIDKETLEKNLLKARKRRQQAEEKKEKDKKQTIDRLLNKKSDSTGKAGSGAKGRKKKPEIPKISYVNNQNGIYVCFPENMLPEFEVFSNFTSHSLKPKTPQMCARNGCNNQKKYSCSRSRLPCCSLECYRILET